MGKYMIHTCNCILTKYFTMKTIKVTIIECNKIYKNTQNSKLKSTG